MSIVRIPKSVYKRMIEHAKRESPLECCGILSGKDKTVQKVFELQNSEKSPVRYSMSPQEQLKVFEEMEKGSMEMIAIYHSHPHTIPFPSETDVKMAFYPEVSSIIISLKDEGNPEVKAFQIEKEAIYLEEIEMIPWFGSVMLNPESVILNPERVMLNLVQHLFRTCLVQNLSGAGLVQHLIETMSYKTLNQVQGDKQ